MQYVDFPSISIDKLYFVVRVSEFNHAYTIVIISMYTRASTSERLFFTLLAFLTRSVITMYLWTICFCFLQYIVRFGQGTFATPVMGMERVVNQYLFHPSPDIYFYF